MPNPFKAQYANFLLLAMGAVWVSGCALSGTDRKVTMTLGEREAQLSAITQPTAWSFGSKVKSKKQTDSKSNTDDVSWQTADASNGVVTFRKPSHREITNGNEILPGTNVSGFRESEKSQANSSVTSSSSVVAEQGRRFIVGHSSDLENSVSVRSSRVNAVAPSGAQWQTPEINSHSSTVQARSEQTHDILIEANHDRLDMDRRTVTADHRFVSGRSDNPVQLQGFEAVGTNQLPSETHSLPVVSLPVTSGSFTSSGGLLSPSPAGSISMPALEQAGGNWNADLERLIARCEQELAGLSPSADRIQQAEYRRRQVSLRFLYLMAGRQEQALMTIPGLELAEQEYWQQVCWAAANSLDVERFPNDRDRAGQSISPLNTALRRLREQADLSIKNMAFCEQISYFGNYQKFAKDEFTPGQEVLLYAEIENFSTEQTVDGEHRTLLRSVIDIAGANGEARWHKTFPATEDRCRNARRDYFHNYQFAIPDRLPLGPHVLKLTVVDDLSGKQASYSLRFLVK